MLESNMYTILSVISIILLCLYTVYFIMLTKKALETIKYLNPAYRFAFGVTIFVMTISAVILAQNGQAAQRIDSLLFMSFYALINLYLYFMAYLY